MVVVRVFLLLILVEDRGALWLTSPGLISSSAPTRSLKCLWTALAISSANGIPFRSTMTSPCLMLLRTLAAASRFAIFLLGPEPDSYTMPFTSAATRNGGIFVDSPSSCHATLSLCLVTYEFNSTRISLSETSSVFTRSSSCAKMSNATCEALCFATFFPPEDADAYRRPSIDTAIVYERCSGLPYQEIRTPHRNPPTTNKR